MKECCDTLLPIFTRIINCSLSHGVMPESLKSAMLLPLLKKKNADYEIFSNFRPISNLKLISKLIEKAVASQLTDYLSFNSLHESFQSAYKRYHSSETALLRVHNDILRSIDNGEGVILVLLDLSAAFDTVNHELLLSRLSTCYGLCGSVLKWFISYLTSRTQFVDINGTFSTIRHLGVGVPQGSVLGLLFYLLYTSPVADIIRRHNLNFHFYADDSQLFLSLKGADRLFDSKLQLEACINDIVLVDGFQ